VLSLCDRTGNVVRPWAEAGFEFFCVDVRHRQSEEWRDDMTWIDAPRPTRLPGNGVTSRPC